SGRLRIFSQAPVKLLVRVSKELFSSMEIRATSVICLPNNSPFAFSPPIASTGTFDQKNAGLLLLLL
ncbi:MAG TPA: hypothetical protein VLT16_15735, partial [Candidatus Limnocylindrales bacterium]|nr:hypothetical protein [Candidatus Limnocylindrales bacterium]